MNFMNDFEIEEAKRVLRHTRVGRYVEFLSNFKDVVDASSDGWAYWKPAQKSADGLMTLVKAAVGVEAGFSRGDMPSEAALKRSVATVRSFVSRKNLVQPELPEDAPAPAPR